MVVASHLLDCTIYGRHCLLVGLSIPEDGWSKGTVRPGDCPLLVVMYAVYTDATKWS